LRQFTAGRIALLVRRVGLQPVAAMI